MRIGVNPVEFYEFIKTKYDIEIPPACHKATIELDFCEKMTTVSAETLILQPAKEFKEKK